MDNAAVTLMEQHPDIVLAFGVSDEYRYRYLSLSSYLSRYNVDRELAFSFAKPPNCTTDVNQKSHLFCAPFSQPHT